MSQFTKIFTEKNLTQLFPPERADNFFEALFGDASDGAYDIVLKHINDDPQEKKLYFELQLLERPRKCLACNLTYGLPEVFSRHPIININKLVEDIDELLGDKATTGNWSLLSTRTVSNEIHSIPLVIDLE